MEALTRTRLGQFSRLVAMSAILVPVSALFATPVLAENAARPNAPNLLIIVSDDQSGLCLGVAGDQRHPTPNLDHLAGQGVFFSRAFCNSPLCTPSRQSLITGLLPHAVGVTRLETRLPDRALTLGHWFSVLGYRTAAIGKMHFNGPSHHGFDTRIDVGQWHKYLLRNPPVGGDHRREWRPFVDPPTVWLNARCEDHGLPAASMESTYFVDRAIEFMNQDRNHPFAMVVGFYDPHAPFRFPREWLGRYRPQQFSGPTISVRDREELPKVFHNLTDDDFRGIQAAYYSSLSFMDSQVGRLVQSLDSSGLGSNTLVVFLSDNGYMLGQHGRVEKNCFYEPAVRVPLIFRWPGHLPEGRQLDQPRRTGRRVSHSVPAPFRALASGPPGHRPDAAHRRKTGSQGPRSRLQRVP